MTRMFILSAAIILVMIYPGYTLLHASSSTSPDFQLIASFDPSTTNVNVPATFVIGVGAQKGFTGKFGLAITPESALKRSPLSDSLNLPGSQPPVYIRDVDCSAATPRQYY